MDGLFPTLDWWPVDYGGLVWSFRYFLSLCYLFSFDISCAAAPLQLFCHDVLLIERGTTKSIFKDLFSFR